ncbi:glycoside hydrolase family 2 protein [Mucisphaera calidilacus]|uniref:Glycoside hydrolase family 2 immunoglobulin-like beta-sandwich domain-containing protein n=1 Tax=Mucisphaera calidilacus TaxID=2527982 RepID=A0A518BY72_9BACT|nr:hypothetical protein [Mucisphaera calidilacus]QDU71904.1 hypothetical protein Pan265_17630 [Mucisphaera calidilacus]
MLSSPRIGSIRPLIRYVDERQAVIDTHFTTLPPVPSEGVNTAPPAVVDIQVDINGLDGFHDEGQTRTPLDDQCVGRIRFDLVEPDRWWPAGMGTQSLYELTITLLDDQQQPIDSQSVTIGLTSVRPTENSNTAGSATFLVNGRPCQLEHVLMIDRIDERALLPATGHSLLFIRDHFGTELLYQAADRAGILLLQSIPIDAEGCTEQAVLDQIDRLAGHPCLAGWYVGHLGDLADVVAEKLTLLDPTHQVLRELPPEWAA